MREKNSNKLDNLYITEIENDFYIANKNKRGRVVNAILRLFTNKVLDGFNENGINKNYLGVHFLDFRL